MKKITDISKDKKYIGYLWMSDREYPMEFHTPKNISEELAVDENSNPFIVEGQLYCKEGETFEKSYSISYNDGEYVVTEYDLNDIRKNFTPDEVKLIKTFIPNRIQASKLKFAQYWKAEPDSLCEDMPVLKPGPFVFIGFEYKEKVGGYKL